MAFGNRGSQSFLVIAGIGAQRVRRREIGHQQIHRAIALGLHGELAFEFQRGAEQRRQRDRLGQKPRDGRRIIVAGKNGVQQRAELHRTAAHVETIHLEGHNAVVAGKIEIVQFNCGFRHDITPWRREPTLTQAAAPAEPARMQKSHRRSC